MGLRLSHLRSASFRSVARCHGPICFVQNRGTQTELHGGVIMNHVAFHDLRGGCLLMVSFTMLAFICAVAMFSAMMRPARWADRLLVHSFMMADSRVWPKSSRCWLPPGRSRCQCGRSSQACIPRSYGCFASANEGSRSVVMTCRASRRCRRSQRPRKLPLHQSHRTW